jgi:predicted nucleotidyltransferase
MASEPTMNPVESALRQIARDLSELKVPWALVGGLAVSARAEPRLTRDVDVAVATADDAAAESIVSSLLGRGYQMLAVLEQEAASRLATVRMRPPGQGRGQVVVDLLFASSGIEPELISAAERLIIVAELDVPVARAGHLIALKLLARDDRHRPQDQDDLLALLAVSGAHELERARRAVSLIQERGFHRGRNLATALDALIAHGE